MLDRVKFDRVLRALVEISAMNGCFILFAPPFAVAIEVRDPKALDSLEEQGVTKAERDNAIREISDLVVANLRGGVEEFIEHKSTEENAGTAEEWRSRSDAVSESLVDDRLRRRYLLKRLSKAPAFTDIDWDIKVKVSDASEVNLQPFPYATVKLKFQREFGEDVVAWLSGRQVESVQVNFSRDELDYLIHSLELAKEALHKAEGDSQP